MTESLAEIPLPQTARLQLVRLTPADAESLQTLTNDPAITGSVHFLPATFELADAYELIARTGAQEAFLGIVEYQCKALAGIFGAHLQEGNRIEIGYWIGRDYQGRGYAAEAATAMISVLCGTFPGHRIVAECRRENHASWKTLQKLGFQSSGVMGKRPGRELLILAR